MTVKDPGAGGSGKVGGADDTDETDIDNGGAGDDQKVSRSTYIKSVTEAKAAKERARLAEEKVNRLEQEKLAASGDKDGTIAALKATLAEKEKSHKSLQQAVVKKALNAQVTAAAAKAGCVDPSAVMKLIDLSDLGDVDGDTLEADQDAVDSVVSALKKEKPYLFSKAGPKINGKNPTGKVDDEPQEKEDLSKLSVDEIKARLKKLGR